MDAHLRSGCVECQSVVSLFERIQETALAMAGQPEPPRDVVFQAKALFQITASTESNVRRIFGRLVFDSFSQLLPAGARAAIPAFRHVLFHAGDYSIDLRLESDPNSIRRTLAGQITSRNDPAARVAGVEVLLRAGRHTVSQTRSNAFGEFILDYADARSLRLEVPLGETAERLEVSLKRLRPMG